LLDVMYEIPSRPKSSAAWITADTIRGITGPELFDSFDQPSAGS